jgi:hypothetical protein
VQNLLLKTPYKFKKSYGGTPEPQTVGVLIAPTPASSGDLTGAKATVGTVRAWQYHS